MQVAARQYMHKELLPQTFRYYDKPCAYPYSNYIANVHVDEYMEAAIYYRCMQMCTCEFSMLRIVDSAATRLLWSHHYYVSACTMGVCKYSYIPCGSTTVLALSSPPLVKGR